MNGLAPKPSVRQALTDEQLEQELAAYPPLTDDDFPDLEKADYATFLRNEHGKLTKGLEKWLYSATSCLGHFL